MRSLGIPSAELGNKTILIEILCRSHTASNSVPSAILGPGEREVHQSYPAVCTHKGDIHDRQRIPSQCGELFARGNSRVHAYEKGDGDPRGVLLSLCFSPSANRH